MNAGAAGGDVDEYCAALVREHDKDRFLCALFVPQEHRQHVLALYAFDVETARIRYVVHEPLVGTLRLQWWHDALAGLRPEEAAGHPGLSALQDALAVTGVDPSPLLSAIESRQAEIDGVPAIDAAAAIILTAARMLGGDNGELIGVAGDAGAALAHTVDPANPAAARAAYRAMRARLTTLPPSVLPAFLPTALVPLRLRRRNIPQWRKQLVLLRAAYFGFPDY
jgi:phytoene/squalene synthetase